MYKNSLKQLFHNSPNLKNFMLSYSSVFFSKFSLSFVQNSKKNTIIYKNKHVFLNKKNWMRLYFSRRDPTFIYPKQHSNFFVFDGMVGNFSFVFFMFLAGFGYEKM